MWRVFGLLALVTVISGMTPIAAHMATAELPPLTIPVVRFGTAGFLLAATVRLLRLERPIPPARWPLLLGVGILCVPVNQVGYLVGIKLANATHAGIAYALVPLLVYWISIALSRSSFTWRLGIASLLAVAGAAAIVATTAGNPRSEGGALRAVLIGDVLLFFAALSWSLFAVLSQPLVKELGAVRTLSAVFLIGTACQLPLAAADWTWFDLSGFDLSRVTWRGWTGLAFITLVTAYVNYLLWYLIVARYDVTRSAVVTNANFLVTVLIDAAFFGQKLTLWVPVGAAALLGGILLASGQDWNTQEKEPAASTGPVD